MKTSIVPIAFLFICVHVGTNLTQAAMSELTDDNWASASQAAVPSLLIGHNDAIKRAYLAPCTNGYFYVYGENLSAIGNLVTPTGIAKWDGREWLPVADGEFVWPSWPLLFTVGEDRYDFHSIEESGVSTWRLIRRGDPDIQIGGDFNQGIYSLVEYKGDLYAGGSFTSVGGTTANRVARWDGSTWAPLGSGVDGWVEAMVVRDDDLYVGGRFKMAGGLMVNGIAKWDGTNWSPVGPVVSGWVLNMVLYRGDLIIGGDIRTAEGLAFGGVAKWDGETWSNLGTGIKSIPNPYSPPPVGDMIVGADGDLYVAGYFFEAGGVSVNCIARWDGTAWSTVGDGGLGINGPIHTLKVVRQQLYAGGNFHGADGQIARGIAKWDGISWSVLASGVADDNDNIVGEINDIAVSGTNIYVTGNFVSAGGVNATNIACWNGATWSPLGMGLNNEFGGGLGSRLAIVGSDLYVTGTFSRAGGVPVQNFAKWDGSSWSSIDSSFQMGTRSPLIVSGSTLYAGLILSSDGLQKGVGKWDGANWTLIGLVDGSVLSMTLVDSTLYVAGSFHSIGGVAATNIARWDGASWAPLGPGIGVDSPTHKISAIAAHGSDLYAAVALSTGSSIEDPPPSQLYKWDGISWTKVGSATDRTIKALATLGDELYVGGVFSVAGGKASGNLARVFLKGAPPLEKTGTQSTSHFRGMPAGGYQVDRTTDFINWENLATRHATETGGIDFTDEEAPQDKAFYRLVPLEP